MSEFIQNSNEEYPGVTRLIHQSYNAIGDRYYMRVEDSDRPTRFDVHRGDGIMIWFDHETPGKVIALNLDGAATTWSSEKREAVFEVLGRPIEESHEELASTLIKERSKEVYFDTETMSQHLDFHIAFREAAGNPFTESEIEAAREHIFNTEE